MEAKENIEIDKYGQPILNSNNLLELLLQGKNINHTIVNDDDDITLYKLRQSELLSTLTVFDECLDSKASEDEFHNLRANDWLMPAEYKTIDVLDWLSKKCNTDEQLERVVVEYILYEERNLVMLLRFFIYLMAYFRENKFICGVGRGSSTCSYILYLIGTHRVDSLKYNLPIEDYLK